MIRACIYVQIVPIRGARCINIIYRRQTSFKKRTFVLVDKSAFLLCCHYKTDPYKAIVQKQSVIFAVRVHLSLGDDGSCA